MLCQVPPFGRAMSRRNTTEEWGLRSRCIAATSRSSTTSRFQNGQGFRFRVRWLTMRPDKRQPMEKAIAHSVSELCRIPRMDRVVLGGVCVDWWPLGGDMNAWQARSSAR